MLIAVIVMTGCQSAPALTAPTLQPFPTMTVGQVVNGALSAEQARISDPLGGISNPATAVAMANRQTPTPNFSACPTAEFEARLADKPATREGATLEILRYLNAGGTLDELTRSLRIQWSAYDETSYIRADDDLTGELEPEIILGYTAPGDVGTILIIGCSNGQYIRHYESIADGLTPPELVWLNDLNADDRKDLVISARQCLNADFCEFATQVLTWNQRLGRFINLLDEDLTSINVPRISDVDNDNVAELVINLDSNGNTTTGPLRTGVNIYDWDGSAYTLSIIQLNSPRYHIQVVQEGDKAFSKLNMAEAIELYWLALNASDLRYWFNDGPVTVTSYAYYRLILAYAYQSNNQISEVIARLNADFPVTEEVPLEDQPIYARMAYTFLNALQISGDMHVACVETLAIARNDETALSLMNRYGSRSPVYTLLDLCPY